MSEPIWETSGTMEHLARPVFGEPKIIETLHYLRLLPDEYIIIGGANLVLRGIDTATSDIDMLVTDEVFTRLKRMRGSEVKDPPVSAQANGAVNKTVWVSNYRTPVPISATTEMGDGYYPMSFESHRQYVEVVNAFPLLGLDQVAEAKAALRRPRDLEHLRKIAQFTGSIVPLPEPAFTAAFREN